MAPKKPKPQASSSQSKSHASASQPTADKRASRSTRSKRRHSESPEPVERDLIAPSRAQATPAKKRRQAPADYSTGANDRSNDVDDDTALQNRGQEDGSQQAFEDRQVQFSDDVETEDSPAGASSAHQVSGQKMAVKRRSTLSPNDGWGERFRVSSARQFLAPEDTEMTDLVPLREVLDNRVQQLMQETPSQDKPDGRQSAPDLTLFDDMKVLDGRRATSTSASIRKRLSTPIVKAPSSQSEYGDKDAVSDHTSNQFDIERQRLQDAILRLSLETEQQRSLMEVHRIELQSITAAKDSTTYADMLKSIRQSYERARKALYETVPESEDLDMTDVETLDMVVSTMKDLAEQVILAGTQFDQREEIELELRHEVNGLIDRLAMSEVNNKRIEAQRIEAVKQGDLIKYEAGKYKDQFESVQEEAAQLKLSLADRSMQLSSQESDNDRLRRSAERLKESLRGYREEDKKMQDLISKMEAEHTDAVTKMNQERETTVQEIEERLEEDFMLRSQLEFDVLQYREQITRMENKIAEFEEQRSSLQTEIQRLGEDVETEHDGRMQAEAAHQLRVNQVEGLEGQLANIEQRLESLNGSLVRIKHDHAEEQEKLAAMTEELQSSQDRVNEVESKLHEAGLEANKLRSKMFEVQQAHQIEVTKLQQMIVTQEEQNETAMNKEASQRVSVEHYAKTLNDKNDELATELEEVHTQMAALVSERDALLQEREHASKESEKKVGALTDELRATQGNLDLEVSRAQDAQWHHEALASDLQNTVAARDQQISNLNTSAAEHLSLINAQANEREAAVSVLEDLLAELRLELGAMAALNESLSRRVEDQSASMLAEQVNKQDIIDALQVAIDDKQQKIRNIEEKALETDNRWQELMDEREKELRSVGECNLENAKTIASLHEQVTFYHDKFNGYVEKVDASLRSAADATARAHEVVQAQQTGLHMDGQDVLSEFEQFNGKVNVAVKQSKKTKGVKKRRAYDSGFGVASDELEGDVFAA